MTSPRQNLKGHHSQDIFLPRSNSLRISATVLNMLYSDSLVSWKTKKQTTAEAEYRSMATGTTCKLIWLKSPLRSLGICHDLQMRLWCDNQGALHIASNHGFYERTKHIEIDCHVVRDQVQAAWLCYLVLCPVSQPVS